MFYYSEVQSLNVYGVAHKVNAKTLSDAKRVASRKSVFYNTVLYIADESALLEDGFGEVRIDPTAAAAVKIRGSWEELN